MSRKKNKAQLIPTSEQLSGKQIWARARERTEAGQFEAKGHDRAPIMMHILTGIMEGRAVKQICREDNLPVGPASIFVWIAQDAELKQAYEIAKAIAAQMVDDDIADLPRQIQAGEISAHNALAVFKIGAWRLAVQNPDKYAPNVKFDHTHMKRQDTQDRLKRAEMRLVS